MRSEHRYQLLLEHNSKSYNYRGINLKLGTNSCLGLDKITVLIGVASMNFEVTECKKVKKTLLVP